MVEQHYAGSQVYILKSYSQENGFKNSGKLFSDHNIPTKSVRKDGKKGKCCLQTGKSDCSRKHGLSVSLMTLVKFW